MNYRCVYIIYNPNSTGPSGRYAKTLRRNLRKQYPELEVFMRETEYAGHAEKIAYDAAIQSKKPLLISSSGDGGYNEVVNGAIRAQKKGARPVCAVLPAGNANDHSRTLQNGPLLDAIKKDKVSSIDLLKSTFTTDGKKTVRYAHSYIGLGLTPVVAVELNKTNLNALNEMWLVVKTFYKFRPFKIKKGAKITSLDSILFANIGQMAKVLTVAKNSKPNDGLFEIIKFPHAHKLRLIRKLTAATIDGLDDNSQSNKYDFKVLKRMPAQFDGEVQYIDKNSVVRITSEHRILKTII